MSSSGYLTIVETKLWRNPKARREVVAQVIDYAQGIARWDYSDLEDAFHRSRRSTTGESATSLWDHVVDSRDDSTNEVDFSDAANRCLRDGRFLLLVIGDGIREGVEGMTEFLQRTPTLQYTLGLVELACYQRPDGSHHWLFVPQIVAKTSEIIRAVVRIEKRGVADLVAVSVEVPSDASPKQAQRANQLSEVAFYEALTSSSSPQVLTPRRSICAAPCSATRLSRGVVYVQQIATQAAR